MAINTLPFSMMFGGVRITHELNLQADKQLEVTLGNDRVVRINVDGTCVMRIKCDQAEIRFDTPMELIVLDGHIFMK